MNGKNLELHSEWERELDCISFTSNFRLKMLYVLKIVHGLKSSKLLCREMGVIKVLLRKEDGCPCLVMLCFCS